MFEILVHKFRRFRRPRAVFVAVALPAAERFRVNLDCVPAHVRRAALPQQHNNCLAVRVLVCITRDAVALLLALAHNFLCAVDRTDEAAAVPPLHPPQQMPPRAELLVALAVFQPHLAPCQPHVRLVQVRRQPAAVKAEPVELFAIVPQLDQRRMKRLIRTPCLSLDVLPHLLRRLPEIGAERGKLRKIMQDRTRRHREKNAVLVCPPRARAP